MIYAIVGIFFLFSFTKVAGIQQNYSCVLAHDRNIILYRYKNSGKNNPR
jgi:hypothetical protein